MNRSQFTTMIEDARWPWIQAMTDTYTSLSFYTCRGFKKTKQSVSEGVVRNPGGVGIEYAALPSLYQPSLILINHKMLVVMVLLYHIPHRADNLGV